MNKGDKFYKRAYKGPQLIHIHHADDDVVVFRWWSRYKQCWRWEVEERWLFEHWLNNNGMYAKNKKDFV